MEIEDLQRLDMAWREYLLACVENWQRGAMEEGTPDQIVDGFVRLWRRQFDTYEDENGKVRCRACKREIPMPSFLEDLINKIMKGGDKL